MAKKTTKPWDSILSDNQTQSIKDEIAHFFKQEHDMDLGIIASDEILDFMLQNIATKAYNKGVQDTKQHIKEAMENMQYDIDVLLKNE